MTPAQRVIFGLVASALLVLGFVKAAESFDPIGIAGQLNNAGEHDFGGSAVSPYS